MKTFRISNNKHGQSPQLITYIKFTLWKTIEFLIELTMNEVPIQIFKYAVHVEKD